jgi:hypothetical protein
VATATPSPLPVSEPVDQAHEGSGIIPGDRAEFPLSTSDDAQRLTASGDDDRPRTPPELSFEDSRALLTRLTGLQPWQLEAFPDELPPLPLSRPGSPTLSPNVTRPSTAIPQRRLSSTAVPIRFRKPVVPPPTDQSLAADPIPGPSPTRSRHGKTHSTEFRNSREFRPLYLVERNRKSTEIDEVLPALPPSSASSVVSGTDSEEEFESALESPYESAGQSSYDPSFDPLSVVSDLISPSHGPEREHPELARREIEEVEESGQATPKASDYFTGAQEASAPSSGPNYESLTAALEHAREQEQDESTDDAFMSTLTSPQPETPLDTSAPLDDRMMRDMPTSRDATSAPSSSSTRLQDAALSAVVGGLAAAALRKRSPSPTKTQRDEVKEKVQSIVEPKQSEPETVEAVAEPSPKGKGKAKKAKKSKKTATAESPVPPLTDEIVKPSPTFSSAPTFVENEEDWNKNKSESVVTDDATLVGESVASPKNTKDSRQKILDTTAPREEESTEVRRATFDDVPQETARSIEPVEEAKQDLGISIEPTVATEEAQQDVPGEPSSSKSAEPAEPAVIEPAVEEEIATTSKAKKGKKNKKDKRGNKQAEPEPEPSTPSEIPSQDDQILPPSEQQQDTIERDILEPSFERDEPKDKVDVMDFLVQEEAPVASTDEAVPQDAVPVPTTPANPEEAKSNVPAGPATPEVEVRPSTADGGEKVKDTNTEENRRASTIEGQSAGSGWGSSLWGAIGWGKKKAPSPTSSPPSSPKPQSAVLAALAAAREEAKRKSQPSSPIVAERKSSKAEAKPTISRTKTQEEVPKPQLQLKTESRRASVPTQRPTETTTREIVQEEPSSSATPHTAFFTDDGKPSFSFPQPSAVPQERPTETLKENPVAEKTTKQSEDATPSTAFFTDDGKPSFTFPPVSTTPTTEKSTESKQEPVAKVEKSPAYVSPRTAFFTDNGKPSFSFPTMSVAPTVEQSVAPREAPIAKEAMAPVDVSPRNAFFTDDGKPSSSFPSMSNTTTEQAPLVGKEAEVVQEQTKPAFVAPQRSFFTDDGRPSFAYPSVPASTQQAPSIEKKVEIVEEQKKPAFVAPRSSFFTDDGKPSFTPPPMSEPSTTISKDTVFEEKPAEPLSLARNALFTDSGKPTSTISDSVPTQSGSSAYDRISIEPSSSKKKIIKTKKEKKAKKSSVPIPDFDEPAAETSKSVDAHVDTSVEAQGKQLAAEPVERELAADKSAETPMETAMEAWGEQLVPEPTPLSEEPPAVVSAESTVKSEQPSTTESSVPAEDEVASPVSKKKAKKSKKSKKAEPESIEVDTAASTTPIAPSAERSLDAPVSESVAAKENVSVNEPVSTEVVQEKIAPSTTEGAELASELTSTVEETAREEPTLSQDVTAATERSMPAEFVPAVEDDAPKTKKSKKSKKKSGISTPQQEPETAIEPSITTSEPVADQPSAAQEVIQPSTIEATDVPLPAEQPDEDLTQPSEEITRDIPVDQEPTSEPSSAPIEADLPTTPKIKKGKLSKRKSGTATPQSEVEIAPEQTAAPGETSAQITEPVAAAEDAIDRSRDIEQPPSTVQAPAIETPLPEQKRDDGADAATVPLPLECFDEDLSTPLEQPRPSDEVTTPVEQMVEDAPSAPTSKKDKKKKKGKKSKPVETPVEEESKSREIGQDEGAVDVESETRDVNEQAITKEVAERADETSEPAEPARTEPPALSANDTPVAEPSQPTDLVVDDIAEASSSKKDKKKKKTKKTKASVDEPSTPVVEEQRELEVAPTEPAAAPSEPEPTPEQSTRELVQPEPVVHDTTPVQKATDIDIQQPSIESAIPVVAEQSEPPQPAAAVEEEVATTSKKSKKKGKKSKADEETPSTPTTDVQRELEPALQAPGFPAVPELQQEPEAVPEPSVLAVPEATVADVAATPETITEQPTTEYPVVAPVAPVEEPTTPAMPFEEESTTPSKTSKKKKAKKGKSVEIEPASADPADVQTETQPSIEAAPAAPSEPVRDSQAETEVTEADRAISVAPEVPVESVAEPETVPLPETPVREIDEPIAEVSQPSLSANDVLSEPSQEISTTEAEAVPFPEAPAREIDEPIANDEPATPSKKSKKKKAKKGKSADIESSAPVTEVTTSQPDPFTESAQSELPAVETAESERNVPSAESVALPETDDKDLDEPTISQAEVAKPEQDASPAELVALPETDDKDLDELDIPQVEAAESVSAVREVVADKPAKVETIQPKPTQDAALPVTTVESITETEPTEPVTKKSKKKKGKKGKSIDTTEPSTPVTEEPAPQFDVPSEPSQDKKNIDDTAAPSQETTRKALDIDEPMLAQESSRDLPSVHQDASIEKTSIDLTTSSQAAESTIVEPAIKKSKKQAKKEKVDQDAEVEQASATPLPEPVTDDIATDVNFETAPSDTVKQHQTVERPELEIGNVSSDKPIAAAADLPTSETPLETTTTDEKPVVDAAVGPAENTDRAFEVDQPTQPLVPETSLDDATPAESTLPETSQVQEPVEAGDAPSTPKKSKKKKKGKKGEMVSEPQTPVPGSEPIARETTVQDALSAPTTTTEESTTRDIVSEPTANVLLTPIEAPTTQREATASTDPVQTQEVVKPMDVEQPRDGSLPEQSIEEEVPLFKKDKKKAKKAKKAELETEAPEVPSTPIETVSSTLEEPIVQEQVAPSSQETPIEAPFVETQSLPEATSPRSVPVDTAGQEDVPSNIPLVKDIAPISSIDTAPATTGQDEAVVTQPEVVAPATEQQEEESTSKKGKKKAKKAKRVSIAEETTSIPPTPVEEKPEPVLEEHSSSTPSAAEGSAPEVPVQDTQSTVADVIGDQTSHPTPAEQLIATPEPAPEELSQVEAVPEITSPVSKKDKKMLKRELIAETKTETDTSIETPVEEPQERSLDVADIAVPPVAEQQPSQVASTESTTTPAITEESNKTEASSAATAEEKLPLATPVVEEEPSQPTTTEPASATIPAEISTEEPAGTPLAVDEPATPSKRDKKKATKSKHGSVAEAEPSVRSTPVDEPAREPTEAVKDVLTVEQEPVAPVVEQKEQSDVVPTVSEDTAASTPADEQFVTEPVEEEDTASKSKRDKKKAKKAAKRASTAEAETSEPSVSTGPLTEAVSTSFGEQPSSAVADATTTSTVDEAPRPVVDDSVAPTPVATEDYHGKEPASSRDVNASTEDEQLSIAPTSATAVETTTSEALTMPSTMATSIDVQQDDEQEPEEWAGLSKSQKKKLKKAKRASVAEGEPSQPATPVEGLPKDVRAEHQSSSFDAAKEIMSEQTTDAGQSSTLPATDSTSEIKEAEANLEPPTTTSEPTASSMPANDPAPTRATPEPSPGDPKPPDKEPDLPSSPSSSKKDKKKAKKQAKKATTTEPFLADETPEAANSDTQPSLSIPTLSETQLPFSGIPTSYPQSFTNNELVDDFNDERKKEREIDDATGEKEKKEEEDVKSKVEEKSVEEEQEKKEEEVVAEAKELEEPSLVVEQLPERTPTEVVAAEEKPTEVEQPTDLAASQESTSSITDFAAKDTEEQASIVEDLVSDTTIPIDITVTEPSRAQDADSTPIQEDPIPLETPRELTPTSTPVEQDQSTTVQPQDKPKDVIEEVSSMSTTQPTVSVGEADEDLAAPSKKKKKNKKGKRASTVEEQEQATSIPQPERDIADKPSEDIALVAPKEPVTSAVEGVTRVENNEVVHPSEPQADAKPTIEEVALSTDKHAMPNVQEPAPIPIASEERQDTATQSETARSLPEVRQETTIAEPVSQDVERTIEEPSIALPEVDHAQEPTIEEASPSKKSKKKSKKAKQASSETAPTETVVEAQPVQVEQPSFVQDESIHPASEPVNESEVSREMTVSEQIEDIQPSVTTADDVSANVNTTAPAKPISRPFEETAQPQSSIIEPEISAEVQEIVSEPPTQSQLEPTTSDALQPPTEELPVPSLSKKDKKKSKKAKKQAQAEMQVEEIASDVRRDVATEAVSVPMDSEVVEPVVEVVAEPTTESVVKPVKEPVVEPIADPVAKSTSVEEASASKLGDAPVVPETTVSGPTISEETLVPIIEDTRETSKLVESQPEPEVITEPADVASEVPLPEDRATSPLAETINTPVAASGLETASHVQDEQLLNPIVEAEASIDPADAVPLSKTNKKKAKKAKARASDTVASEVEAVQDLGADSSEPATQHTPIAVPQEDTVVGPPASSVEQKSLVDDGANSLPRLEEIKEENDKFDSTIPLTEDVSAPLPDTAKEPILEQSAEEVPAHDVHIAASQDLAVTREIATDEQIEEAVSYNSPDAIATSALVEKQSADIPAADVDPQVEEPASPSVSKKKSKKKGKKSDAVTPAPEAAPITDSGNIDTTADMVPPTVEAQEPVAPVLDEQVRIEETAVQPETSALPETVVETPATEATPAVSEQVPAPETTIAEEVKDEPVTQEPVVERKLNKKERKKAQKQAAALVDEPIVEREPVVEPSIEPIVEPIAGPTVESTVEPTVEPAIAEPLPAADVVESTAVEPVQETAPVVQEPLVEHVAESETSREIPEPITEDVFASNVEPLPQEPTVEDTIISTPRKSKKEKRDKRSKKQPAVIDDPHEPVSETSERPEQVQPPEALETVPAAIELPQFMSPRDQDSTIQDAEQITSTTAPTEKPSTEPMSTEGSPITVPIVRESTEQSQEPATSQEMDVALPLENVPTDTSVIQDRSVSEADASVPTAAPPAAQNIEEQPPQELIRDVLVDTPATSNPFAQTTEAESVSMPFISEPVKETTSESQIVQEVTHDEFSAAKDSSPAKKPKKEKKKSRKSLSASEGIVSAEASTEPATEVDEIKSVKETHSENIVTQPTIPESSIPEMPVSSSSITREPLSEVPTKPATETTDLSNEQPLPELEEETSLSRSMSKKAKKKAKKDRKSLSEIENESSGLAMPTNEVPPMVVADTPIEQVEPLPMITENTREVVESATPADESAPVVAEADNSPALDVADATPEDTYRSIGEQQPIEPIEPIESSTTHQEARQVTHDDSVPASELSPSLKAIQDEAADLRLRAEALDTELAIRDDADEPSIIEPASMFDIVNKLTKKEKKSRKNKSEAETMPTTPAAEPEAAVETKEMVETPEFVSVPTTADERVVDEREAAGTSMPAEDEFVSADEPSRKPGKKEKKKGKQPIVSTDEPSETPTQSSAPIVEYPEPITELPTEVLPTFAEPLADTVMPEDTSQTFPFIDTERAIPDEPAAVEIPAQSTVAQDLPEAFLKEEPVPSRKLSKKDKKRAKEAAALENMSIVTSDDVPSSTPAGSQDVAFPDYELAVSAPAPIVETLPVASVEIPKEPTVEEVPAMTQAPSRREVDVQAGASTILPTQTITDSLPIPTVEQQETLLEESSVPSRKLSKKDKKKAKQDALAAQEREASIVVDAPLPEISEPVVTEMPHTSHEAIQDASETTSVSREPAHIEKPGVGPVAEETVTDQRFNMEPEATVTEGHSEPSMTDRPIEAPLPERTEHHRDLPSIPEPEQEAATASTPVRKESKKDKKKAKKQDTIDGPALPMRSDELMTVEGVRAGEQSASSSTPMDQQVVTPAETLAETTERTLFAPVLEGQPQEVFQERVVVEGPTIEATPDTEVTPKKSKKQKRKSKNATTPSEEPASVAPIVPVQEMTPELDIVRGITHDTRQDTRKNVLTPTQSPTKSTFEPVGGPTLSQPKREHVRSMSNVSIPDVHVRTNEWDSASQPPLLHKKSSKKHKLAALFERGASQDGSTAERGLRREASGSVRNLAERYENQSRSVTPVLPPSPEKRYMARSPSPEKRLASRSTTPIPPPSPEKGHVARVASRSQLSLVSPVRSDSKSPAREIDFAATVAASLQESGFDPGYVINDRSFSRSNSISGARDITPDDDVAAAKERASRSRLGSLSRSSSVSGSPKLRPRRPSGPDALPPIEVAMAPTDTASFDPLDVLNDPAFATRKSPPGVLEEADPDELAGSSSLRRNKSNKKRKPLPEVTAESDAVRREKDALVMPKTRAKKSKKDEEGAPRSQDGVEYAAAKTPAIEALQDVPLAVETPVDSTVRGVERTPSMPHASDNPTVLPDVPAQATDVATTLIDVKERRSRKEDKMERKERSSKARKEEEPVGTSDTPILPVTFDQEPRSLTAEEPREYPFPQVVREEEILEEKSEEARRQELEKERDMDAWAASPKKKSKKSRKVEEKAEEQSATTPKEVASALARAAVHEVHKRRTHPVSFDDEQPDEKRLHTSESTQEPQFTTKRTASPLRVVASERSDLDKPAKEVQSSTSGAAPANEPSWSFVEAQDTSGQTPVTAQPTQPAETVVRTLRRSKEPTTPLPPSASKRSIADDQDADDSPALQTYPTISGAATPSTDHATKERTSYLFDSSPSTRAYGTSPAVAPQTPAHDTQWVDDTPSKDKGKKPRTESQYGQASPTKEIGQKEPYQSLFGDPNEKSETLSTSVAKAERTPGTKQLESIEEVSPDDTTKHKKSRSIADVGAPERGLKSARRTESLRQLSDCLRSPPPSTPTPTGRRSVASMADSTGGRDSPWQQVNESIDRTMTLSPARRMPRSSPSADPLKQYIAEQRSPSVQSQRSLSNIARLRSPDQERPLSSMSNHSERSLRRVDRQTSGDLRSASRLGAASAQDAKSAQPNLSSTALAAGAAAIAGIAAPPVYDPVRGTGRGRRASMAETFVSDSMLLRTSSLITDSLLQEAWGEAQRSPSSPSRPPSVRKRQSMQIMDLQTQLDQLAAQNEAVETAKARAEEALQAAQHQRQVDEQLVAEEVEARDRQIHQRDIDIAQLKDTLQRLQEEIARLNQLNNALTEANHNLTNDANERYGQLQSEGQVVYEQLQSSLREQESLRNQYAQLQSEGQAMQQQWQTSQRDLEELRRQHTQMQRGLADAVRDEVGEALDERNAEIDRLTAELATAREQIKNLQKQILASKKPSESFLTVRDEDYFDSACQQLCQHVQQWVLRFSKFSDTRACRLSSEIAADTRLDASTRQKIDTRLDNAILDGSDVDALLADRVKRRDVFMSVVMTMIWEYVFTRYLFGMDREQRQKLKALEKTLSEVGPPRAVAQWRAITLTLLARREPFMQQRAQDTEAVVHEIYSTLSTLLPPPSHLQRQIQESLRNVMRLAVELSIEMRTQRAEYIMLPPLQPEYDTKGDLVAKVTFNASLMNERSGETTSNDELQARGAVVKIVLFPLVVKKGDDFGEGEDEIVVCPAQVLVQGTRSKKVVRVMSGAMSINRPDSRASRISRVTSVAPPESTIMDYERPGSNMI